jgi:hypothetical protein
VTIVLLSVGVLFLAICLFHETIQPREELKVRKKQLLEYIDCENTESVQIDNVGFGKLKIFEIITLLSISPIFANSWQQIGNSCQNRVSFFGLVTVWSGSITEAEYDNFGRATGNTRRVDRTPDGNWDWFW